MGGWSSKAGADQTGNRLGDVTMDTPEKEKFLDTVRGLRKEAEQKLTGNRHYLAIQKLDEIAESVESRAMSSEEMGAISGVLRGEHEAAIEAASEVEPEVDQAAAPEVDPTPAEEGVSEEAPAVEAVDVALAGAGAGVVAAGVIAASDEAEAVTDSILVEEIVADDLSSPSEEIIEAEVAVDEPISEPTGEVNILPNWWKKQDNVGVEPQVIEEVAAEVVVPPALEEVAEPDTDGGLDFASIAAGTVAVAVAGAAVSQLATSGDETKEVETPDVADVPDVPEVELDMPEVELETPEVDMPSIDIPVSEAVVGEIELEKTPVVLEEPEIAPEIQDSALVPEIEIQTSETADLSVEDLGLGVPTGDVMETAIADPAPVELEVAEEISVPDIEISDPEPIAPVEEEVVEVVSDEVDQGTSAIAVAAGAAAVAAAVAAAGSSDETSEQVVEVAEPEPAVEPETPEKLSLPDNAPEATVVEEVTAPIEPKGKLLDGTTIAHHPSYGGSRGGVMKRFFNSLRGKDYI